MVRIALAIAIAALAFPALAQTNCTRIGNQYYCSGPSVPGGGYNASRIGNSTFYNYDNLEKARRQQMPSSSLDVGSTRFYDNGVTRNRVGNTDFYSDGTTANRIGNSTFFSDGTTCTKIGDQTFCN